MALSVCSKIGGVLSRQCKMNENLKIIADATLNGIGIVTAA
jgi:hypothetical protein